MTELEAAARLYLVASRMNVDLAMAVMRRVYGRGPGEEHLDAVTRAADRVRGMATGPDRLRDSALTQLVRHDGAGDTVRINMARHHPCNTVLQIEQAMLRAYPDLEGYQSDHMGVLFSFDEFYLSRVFGRDGSVTGTPWSAAFARICDVSEEADSPYGYCGMGRTFPVDMQYDESREDFVMAAKTYLIRHHGDDRTMRESLERLYPAMSEDTDWAIAEARRRLRAEAAGLGAGEIERFAWIQAVCGLFGRKNVRDWVVREYPYAGESRIDSAMKEAARRLSADIEEAGVVALMPAVDYKYASAGSKKAGAQRKARQQWGYLDDVLIDRIFAEYEKRR